MSRQSYRTEIVIPTLAEAQRSQQLVRAIESVQSQGARALVIVNGKRFDPTLKEELERRTDIRLVCIAQGGLPNAIFVGRTAVASEYFGFLDDDDYLLPGAIGLREAFLDAHRECDVVVTNGIREEWGFGAQLYKSSADIDRIAQDPLAALLESNWMTPCGASYRASGVSAEVFRDLTKYAEWTDVAFRLIDDFRFAFVMENTFIQSDTPGSLSKRAEQARFILGLCQKMSAKLRTSAQKRLWDQRMCSLYHSLAEDELAAGHRREAMRHHLHSLLHAPRLGIPRYLLFTRKLLT